MTICAALTNVESATVCVPENDKISANVRERFEPGQRRQSIVVVDVDVAGDRGDAAQSRQR